MRKINVFFVLSITLLLMIVGCNANKEQKVTCSFCKGTGQVKYYYGNGDKDYNMGPCTSCDEKGYNWVVPEGNSNGGKNVVCSSCEKYVEKVITKKDVGGEEFTWCADCWKSYDDIMGR